MKSIFRITCSSETSLYQCTICNTKNKKMKLNQLYPTIYIYELPRNTTKASAITNKRRPHKADQIKIHLATMLTALVTYTL